MSEPIKQTTHYLVKYQEKGCKAWVRDPKEHKTQANAEHEARWYRNLKQIKRVAVVRITETIIS